MLLKSILKIYQCELNNPHKILLWWKILSPNSHNKSVARSGGNTSFIQKLLPTRLESLKLKYKSQSLWTL